MSLADTDYWTWVLFVLYEITYVYAQVILECLTIYANICFDLGRA